MRVLQIIGILLIVIGVVIMPFGHWLNRIYYLIAIFIAVIGVLLIAKRLLAHWQKDNKALTELDNIPPVSGEARGFHGSQLFHDATDNSEIDDGSD